MASNSPGVGVGRRAARLVSALGAQLLYWTAVVWRRALLRTTVVAVTGTHGKTTTKEMLGTILAQSGPTIRSAANENTGLPLTRNVLRIRPWHRFAVFEVGIGAPGEMRRLARLVRPDVAVVLSVLRAHTRAFADADAQAGEKAVLLRALGRRGAAVLNADDPRVAAMAEGVAGTVVRTGTSPGLDVWAENTAARWPERLAFDLRTGAGESCRVATRLVGAHWTTGVVAALAAARHLGVPPSVAVAAVATVEPFAARLQPLALPNGVVVLRDDYDASIEAWEAALAVLAGARAARRVAVLTDASDYGATPRRKRLAELGRAAAGSAEIVMFIGEHAAHGRDGAIAAGLEPGRAYACGDLAGAVRLLGDVLRPGDLVLMKGWTSDHLARLFFALLGPIACTKTRCGKTILCDDCVELGASPADRARAAVVPPRVSRGASGEAP